MIKSPINKDIEDAKLGIRPFVFDIVAPDGVTSFASRRSEDDPSC